MHVIEKLQFCPSCGASGFAADSGKSLRCEGCGLRLFVNVASAAGAFVEDGEGRLVLVRRAREPSKGKLALPGGFIDAGETAEAGLAREVREELDLKVNSFHYLCSYPNEYHYAGVTYQTLDLFFVCTVDDFGGAVALEEVEEFLVIEPSKLDVSELAFPSARVAFEAYKRDAGARRGFGGAAR
jgi:NAD+ diphosphatase